MAPMGYCGNSQSEVLLNRPLEFAAALRALPFHQFSAENSTRICLTSASASYSLLPAVNRVFSLCSTSQPA